MSAVDKLVEMLCEERDLRKRAERERDASRCYVEGLEARLRGISDYDELADDIVKVLGGHKAYAIKVFRSVTHADLRTSKEAIEKALSAKADPQ